MGPWLNGTVPRYAAGVVGLNVEVIVAGNTPAGLAATSATKTIPIVIATMEDPVQQDSPRASLTREAASRGSTSRRRLAAHRPAFRIKIACNVGPLVPLRVREPSKASGSSRQLRCAPVSMGL